MQRTIRDRTRWSQRAAGRSTTLRHHQHPVISSSQRGSRSQWTSSSLVILVLILQLVGHRLTLTYWSRSYDDDYDISATWHIRLLALRTTLRLKYLLVLVSTRTFGIVISGTIVMMIIIMSGSWQICLFARRGTLCLRYLHSLVCAWMFNIYGSYRSGKTGKCQGNILFFKSQGKWSWIMQTADSWFFASPNIKKQANLQLPLNIKKLEVFQLQRGFVPWPLDQGLCHLHIALLVRFHYLIPFMTFVQ